MCLVESSSIQTVITDIIWYIGESMTCSGYKLFDCIMSMFAFAIFDNQKVRRKLFFLRKSYENVDFLYFNRTSISIILNWCICLRNVFLLNQVRTKFSQNIFLINENSLAKQTWNEKKKWKMNSIHLLTFSCSFINELIFFKIKLLSCPNSSISNNLLPIDEMEGVYVYYNIIYNARGNWYRSNFFPL